MTNELEKQFFDTFGIEPRSKKCTCNVRDFAKCTTYYCASCEKALKKEYPQITDRILLELICINNRNTRCIQELIVPRNLKLLKKSTLKRLIENSKVCFQIKHQVRTLFEKG